MARLHPSNWAPKQSFNGKPKATASVSWIMTMGGWGQIVGKSENN